MFGWFIDPNNKTGFRFIVVDAYNEPIPIIYYMQNDFEFLFSTKEQQKEWNEKRIFDKIAEGRQGDNYKRGK